MAKSQAASAPPLNHLLARLPQKDYQRLLPHLQRFPLDFKKVLNVARSPIEHVYFPNMGVVSAVTLMEDGTVIEVATIGNEGLVGLTAFLGKETSPNQMVVQVPGEAMRLDAEVFRSASREDGPLRRLVVRYHAAFLRQISQAIACNGLHHIQERCCRWVLMTHDRVDSDEFPLTHEFLAHMLGVRRVSVTEVLQPLQEAGLLRNHRGMVTVLNRKGLEAASCECYRTVQEEFDRLLS